MPPKDRHEIGNAGAEKTKRQPPKRGLIQPPKWGLSRHDPQYRNGANMPSTETGAPFYILGRDDPKGRTGQDRLSPCSPCLTHTSSLALKYFGHFCGPVTLAQSVRDIGRDKK